MERVLLTGAGGFVGSHVLRRILTDTEAHVVCPVTFTHRGITDRIRLVLREDISWHERVTVIPTDLAAPISAQTDYAFGPIDTVINVASESHVDRSISDPAEFVLNNVALICHLLDWARKRQHQPGMVGYDWPEIEVILQVSTDEVYGPAPRGTDHREWEHGHLPSNPYAASKAAQEDIAFAYWRTYDLPIVLTNTMNIIGQMQHPEKFVPQVIKKVLYGEEVIIHGSPEGEPGSRFYLHAGNQAHGLMYVLDYVVRDEGMLQPSTRLEESLRYSGGGDRPYRFHIVGEREVDNLEMARMIEAAVHRHAPRGVGIPPMKYTITDFHSSRPGHDLRYALDGSKMKAIGWEPPHPLAESLDETVKWTLDNPEWLTE